MLSCAFPRVVAPSFLLPLIQERANPFTRLVTIAAVCNRAKFAEPALDDAVVAAAASIDNVTGTIGHRQRSAAVVAAKKLKKKSGFDMGTLCLVCLSHEKHIRS